MHAMKYLLVLMFFSMPFDHDAFCNETRSELSSEDLEWVNDYLDDCD